MDLTDRYRERIAAAYPDLAIDSIHLNQEGMVNDVVIVNGDVVFRFPKSDWARGALAREARVLAVVRERTPLEVPRLELIAEDMSCHPLVAGEPLTRDTLQRMTAGERERTLEQLGAFLLALHGIEPAVLAGIGASDAARTRDDWLAFHERVEETLFPLLMRYQRDWVTAHFAPVVSGELDLSHRPALIHGDLALYHILHDTGAMWVTGVIDFGTAGIGDPATDIACLIYQYGESMVRQLADYYPRLAECIERARFWTGTMELQWALAGVVNNDRSLLVAHIGGARDTRPAWSPVV